MVAEAITMLENDVASVENIDKAMKLGAGYPMGPFELLDQVGLELYVAVVQGGGMENMKRSLLIEKMIKEGKTGRMAGEGFYKYDSDK